jgi:hypothetical protein
MRRDYPHACRLDPQVVSSKSPTLHETCLLVYDGAWPCEHIALTRSSAGTSKRCGHVLLHHAGGAEAPGKCLW